MWLANVSSQFAKMSLINASTQRMQLDRWLYAYMHHVLCWVWHIELEAAARANYGVHPPLLELAVPRPCCQPSDQLAAPQEQDQKVSARLALWLYFVGFLASCCLLHSSDAPAVTTNGTTSFSSNKTQEEYAIMKWELCLCTAVSSFPPALLSPQKGNDCEYPSNVTTWTMHGIW